MRLPKKRFDRYTYDDQQLYTPVRKCLQVTQTHEVSLSTETTHPGRLTQQYAFPYPSKTHFQNLTTQKMSERQGVLINDVISIGC